MIDVAHDGDDRRARQQVRRIVRGIEHALFDVGLGDAPHGVAELLGDELGGIGVDRVGDLRHVALLHEDADHVDRALGHAIGQFLNRDRLGDRHFADDLFLGLAVAVAAHALDAAAERGDRAFAHLVGGKGGDDGEPAAALFAAAAGAAWARAPAAPAAPPRRALRGASSSSASSAGRAPPGFAAAVVGAEALLGDFVGLALGFFVVLAAFFFVALARFRRSRARRARLLRGSGERGPLPRRSCVLRPRADAHRRARERARCAPRR